MKVKIVTRQEIEQWLAKLPDHHELFAPVADDQRCVYKRVKNPNEVLFDYSNTLISAKEIFFPKREVLFNYTRGKLEPKPVLESDRVLWGIRPCDAKGLLLLDEIFGGEYKDASYLQKRSKTTLVGLACVEPLDSCFCSTLKGGPHSKEGLDILLTPLSAEEYFIEILTPKGENLWDAYGRDATDQDRQRRASLERQVRDKIVKTCRAPENLEAVFDDPYWEEVSRKCVSCGVCTYLCPTCHCFDMADEDGSRVRFWDSCASSLFTKQASGENPREEIKSRYRQRIYHKFSYLGKPFCVGCGRCLRSCPTKMDIVEILNNVPRG